MDDFNPNSPNAMFSRIDEHLKAQDSTADARHKLVEGKLGSIEAQAMKTNGRVTELENERWRQRGIVASIGFVIALLSWALPLVLQYLKHS